MEIVIPVVAIVGLCAVAIVAITLRMKLMMTRNHDRNVTIVAEPIRHEDEHEES